MRHSYSLSLLAVALAVSACGKSVGPRDRARRRRHLGQDRRVESRRRSDPASRAGRRDERLSRRLSPHERRPAAPDGSPSLLQAGQRGFCAVRVVRRQQRDRRILRVWNSSSRKSSSIRCRRARRKYWHPHNAEILSGQLVAPGIPEPVEKELMKGKMNSVRKDVARLDGGPGTDAASGRTDACLVFQPRWRGEGRSRRRTRPQYGDRHCAHTAGAPGSRAARRTAERRRCAQEAFHHRDATDPRCQGHRGVRCLAGAAMSKTIEATAAPRPLLVV